MRGVWLLMENTRYIYGLVCPLTDEVKYVGATKNTYKRFCSHISKTKGTPEKRNWIQKLANAGLRPTLEILDVVDSGDWEFWERHYISLYHSWGFNLLNKSFGGAKCKFSLQTRMLQSKQRKGIPKTKEFVDKVKASGIYEWKREMMKGSLNPGKKQMKPVVQYSLDGTHVKEWDCADNAAKSFGAKRGYNVSRVCRGIKSYDSAYGFIWKYKQN